MTLLGENTVEQCVFMYILGTSTIVYVTIWDVRLTKKAITVVSRKYAPPFATLASVQNAGGGLYAGCEDFSRDYAPLPVPIKHELIVGGG